jgi:hypothetical protein
MVSPAALDQAHQGTLEPPRPPWKNPSIHPVPSDQDGQVQLPSRGMFSASCAAVPPCDGAGEGIPLETSGFPWHIHNFQSETAAALVPALLCSLIREVVDSPSPMHSRSSRAAARVAAAHCEPAAHPGMAGLNSHCTTRSVLHSNLTGSSAGGGSSASDGSSCPMHPSTLGDVSVAPGGRHTAIPPGGLFSPPGSDSKCGQGQNISVHSREKIHFTLAEVLYTRI